MVWIKVREISPLAPWPTAGGANVRVQAALGTPDTAGGKPRLKQTGRGAMRLQMSGVVHLFKLGTVYVARCA